MVEAMPGQAPNGCIVSCIGVIGLGHMGHAFAVNLVEDGHQVLVYDRDPQRTATVTGARAAAQLADLAACDVVLTSLPDDEALAAVTLGPEGLAGILAPGSVHISTSTVSAAMSRRVAELIVGRNIGRSLGVSERAWKDFVDHEMVPRFPEGLTVTETNGLSRDRATGTILREPSEHVEIVLPGRPDDEARLEAIVSAYKRRFKQKSVLVLVRDACVSF